MKKIILLVLVVILIMQIQRYADLVELGKIYAKSIGAGYDDSMLGGWLNHLEQRIFEFNEYLLAL